MAQRIAYIMSRFPTIAETFILYEILELKGLGLEIEVFPLLRQNEPVTHAEVQTIEPHVHYASLLSTRTLSAQLYWLFFHPIIYLKSLFLVIRGNLSSPGFLGRAVVTFPLAALFARQMKALGIEHVHAHWATHPALAAYIIKQLTGLPYSFTAHANDIYVEQTMLDEKIRQAHFVVTISEYNRQFLQQLYGDELANKISIIRCGIDRNVFHPKQAVKHSDQFTIICVARLEEKKGHFYLIEACAQLKIQGVDFCCLLVGDGEQRPQIEEQVKQLGLTEHVILLGFQPRHRVRELLATSNVMVLASIITKAGRMEGIPVALMEALAAGLPVIATDISGIPELIEDGKTGLLVPERSSEMLTTALLKLSHDPQLGQELGQNGLEKVRQEFDLHSNAAKLFELFNPN